MTTTNTETHLTGRTFPIRIERDGQHTLRLSMIELETIAGGLHFLIADLEGRRARSKSDDAELALASKLLTQLTDYAEGA